MYSSVPQTFVRGVLLLDWSNKELKELPAFEVGRLWCLQGNRLPKQKPTYHRGRKDWSTHALGTGHRCQTTNWNAFHCSHQRAVPHRPWPCCKAQWNESHPTGYLFLEKCPLIYEPWPVPKPLDPYSELTFSWTFLKLYIMEIEIQPTETECWMLFLYLVLSTSVIKIFTLIVK